MNYISHEEYVDAPVIYGQHARYWASLDVMSKIATIRRVGLFGFLREVCGYADAERIRERLEEQCVALAEERDAAKKRVQELEQQNRELEQKLTETTAELTKAQQRNGRGSKRLLTPPSATDIMHAFNRMCPDHRQWFFRPYEDPHTGVITFAHNHMFYPFSELSVARGKLRLCDQDGDPVCLTQCHPYAALPAKLAQHLIPTCFHAYRMRVLFVTNDARLWLADPLIAQDVLLEIWARYDHEKQTDRGRYHDYDQAITAWKALHDAENAVAYGTCAETRFDLIISVEEFLSGGPYHYSKDQIEHLRNRCYAEYLSLYFNDKDDEECNEVDEG